MSDSDDPKALFTKAALAKRLSVCTKTIEGEVKRGMPCVVIGGRRRFEWEEVMRWLKRKNRGGAAV